jgi:hypothetical protein
VLWPDTDPVAALRAHAERVGEGEPAELLWCNRELLS